MLASWQAGNQAWSSWRPSTNRGVLLLPRTERTGQVMAAACSGPKVHVGAGQLSLEEGRGVLHGLRDPARYGLLDRLAPAAVTDQGQEAVHGALGVAGLVAVGERRHRVCEGRAGGRGEERRFEQHQRRHPGGVLGREFQGDRSTEGVSHHVGASHSEVVEEPDGVLGLLGDAGRPRVSRVGAPTNTPPLVADALEALERRLRHQRLQRVGDVRAVDEQHRRTRPHDLILQFDAVDLGVSHDDSSVLPGPGGPVGTEALHVPSRRDTPCGAR
jgi:hypothetical protein